MPGRGHNDGRISRRRAMRAYHRGDRVYLAHAIARKPYRCPVCREGMDIGAEHVILRYRRRGGVVHHHLHHACVPYEDLSKPEWIAPREAARSRVNRRVRR